MKKRIRMRFEDQEFSVTAERSAEGIIIERDGARYTVEILPEEQADAGAAEGATAGAASGAAAGSGRPAAAAAKPPAGAAAAGAPAAGSGSVTAPMTGTIKEVLVAVGDTVSEGDHVMVMEAMKMDMEISAHLSGTVTEILCGSGDSVRENQALLTIG